MSNPVRLYSPNPDAPTEYGIRAPEPPGFNVRPVSVGFNLPQVIWGSLPAPARDSYRSLVGLIGELSPGAAIRDAIDAYADMNRSAWAGRGWDAAGSGVDFLTAALGIIPANRAAARTGKIVAHQTAEAIPGRDTRHLENLIDAPPAEREAFTARVSDALTDTAGVDVLNKSAGLNALPTRQTTGAFRPTPTAPLEINPGFAMPVEVPLSLSGGVPSLDPVAEQALRTTATLRGAMTAQLANPHNAQVRAATGNNLTVPLESKVDPERMADFVNRYGIDRVVAADTGAGVNVLNFGDRLTNTEAREIASILSGNPYGYARTREVSNPTMNYVDLTNDWKGPIGSRDITRRVVGELERLDQVAPGGLAKMDNAELRQMAARLHAIYDEHAKLGQEVHPGLMNFLRLMSQEGIPGVKAAMRDNKELLPGLGLGFLLPALADDGERSDAY